MPWRVLRYCRLDTPGVRRIKNCCWRLAVPPKSPAMRNRHWGLYSARTLKRVVWPATVNPISAARVYTVECAARAAMVRDRNTCATLGEATQGAESSTRCACPQKTAWRSARNATWASPVSQTPRRTICSSRTRFAHSEAPNASYKAVRRSHALRATTLIAAIYPAPKPERYELASGVMRRPPDPAPQPVRSMRGRTASVATCRR